MVKCFIGMNVRGPVHRLGMVLHDLHHRERIHGNDRRRVVVGRGDEEGAVVGEGKAADRFVFELDPGSDVALVPENDLAIDLRVYGYARQGTLGQSILN